MPRLKRFIKSLKHALNGLRYAMRESNFQIEIFFGCGAILMAFVFNISGWESAVLIMTILLVLVLEIINTIFERMIDIQNPRMHPYAKVVKDMMAGAVLLACMGSLLVGAVIFLPYLGMG